MRNRLLVKVQHENRVEIEAFNIFQDIKGIRHSLCIMVAWELNLDLFKVYIRCF